MSIWGVNQSLPAPTIVTASSDVACPAGSETTVLSGASSGSAPGQNIVVESSTELVVVLGATAPSAMTVNAKVGAGADYDTWTVPPALLVANAVLNLAPVLVGVLARNLFYSGVTINITVNPTGQAVTLKAQSRCVNAWAIGLDA